MQMKTLIVLDCGSWRALRGLGSLVGLEQLHVEGFKDLAELPKVSKLTKLKILEVEGCDSLKYILGLDNVISLKELRLTRCARLEELPNLEQLT